MLDINKDIIRDIVLKTVQQEMISGDASIGQNWLCEDIDAAVTAAKAGYEALKALSIAQRQGLIDEMRRTAVTHAEDWAQMAYEETGFGSVAHKVTKCKIAAQKTPGTENITAAAYTGDNGLTLVECAPYGVIGAITPSTNPVATIINNAISMIAAGNAVVFNPHPGAKKSSLSVLKALNETIRQMVGIGTLLCTVKNPNIESASRLMSHKDIRLLAITGGEAVVNAAMKSGKKCIAAGPGNPPAIVDASADIEKAAKDIISGASFDNNILCISEKETIVVDSVADELLKRFEENGAYIINQEQTRKVFDTVLIEKDGKYVINRAFVGKDATKILDACGITYNGRPVLIVAETEMGHPFVMTEMLMPVMPVVRAKSFEQALEWAYEAEQGFGHSAMIHATHVERLSLAAQKMNTTIFVKNAPSYAGIGYLGEGYTTLTIATPTGEGLTSAISFTRSRRCVLSGSFRIV